VPNDSDVTWLSSGLLTAILDSQYKVMRAAFFPYMSVGNVEVFANKGFFKVCLSNNNGNSVIIVNTHNQSNTEVSWWFGERVVRNFQKQQFQQILDYCEYEKEPVFIVGDLNNAYSPHPHVRFLRPDHLINKNTFVYTDEDLDHIAWCPLQWARAFCLMCDIDNQGPQLISCKIHDKPWSDHRPVEFIVNVPPMKYKHI